MSDGEREERVEGIVVQTVKKRTKAGEEGYMRERGSRNERRMRISRAKYSNKKGKGDKKMSQ